MPTMHTSANWLRNLLAGVAAGAGAVAVVSGAVAIFDQFVPVLSLGVLYVFAVLPIAVLWGTAYGVGVAVASMLAFNFLFLPPRYTFTIEDRSVWLSLAVYLTTAIVVGGLASGARRRRDEAVQREREAALLADVAAELLRGSRLDDELDGIAEQTAGVLGVSSARIDLDGHGARPQHETAYPLTVDRGSIGTLYTPESEEPRLDVRKRLIPALALVLAIAREQERLEHDALEAEALRRTDSIKTALLQAVSHDLRTPLATIEQALDGLESGVLVLSDDDRTELLETIRIEHTRLKRLVDNLLDLSRLQAGGSPSTPELWTAEELVAQALDELGSQERVQVDGRPDVPAASVDAVQIQRALVNLLENALNVSPPGEPVHVRITATRKELLIRVTDRGPGIPEEERERIFQPFYRIEGHPDRRGAGLGLAIARGFAEANGGRIWVESRGGQGASFVLALPAVELPVTA
jgi:two-component system, OmpR family, sensor histidine kinase KdpD